MFALSSRTFCSSTSVTCGSPLVAFVLAVMVSNPVPIARSVARSSPKARGGSPIPRLSRWAASSRENLGNRGLVGARTASSPDNQRSVCSPTKQNQEGDQGMRATTMRQYLGMEVRMTDQTLYVAQCDRELGITMHDMDTGQEVVCLNREILLTEPRPSGKIRDYHEAFSEILRCIEEGKIEWVWRVPISKTRRPYKTHISSRCGTAMQCAFK